jgi:hypothetical protein
MAGKITPDNLLWVMPQYLYKALSMEQRRLLIHQGKNRSIEQIIEDKLKESSLKLQIEVIRQKEQDREIRECFIEDQHRGDRKADKKSKIKKPKPKMDWVPEEYQA